MEVLQSRTETHHKVPIRLYISVAAVLEASQLKLRPQAELYLSRSSASRK